MATTNPIITQMLDFGPDVYYDPKIRNVLNDHIEYLRSVSKVFAIDDGGVILNYRGEYDFYKFLQSITRIHIEPKHFYIIRRVNYIDSPFETPIQLTELLLPPGDEIDNIIQIERSSSRI